MTVRDRAATDAEETTVLVYEPARDGCRNRPVREVAVPVPETWRWLLCASCRERHPFRRARDTHLCGHTTNAGHPCTNTVDAPDGLCWVHGEGDGN